MTLASVNENDRVAELERLLEHRTQERDTARRILAQQATSDSFMPVAQDGVLSSRLQTVVTELRRISEELEERNTALATANWRLEQRVNERTAALQAALEAKRTSEERFRSVADNVPQLVWTSHPEGHWDFANQRWQTYTGQSQSEANDMGWLQAIHEDDRGPTMTAWHAASVSGRPLLVEHRIYAKDGSWRWFETQAMPAGPAKGPDARWVGSTSDIHARKLATDALADAKHLLEQQLADIQARFDAVFQVSTDALFVVAVQADALFVHEAVNPAFEQLTGIWNEAAAGRQASEFMAAATAHVFEDHYRHCAQSGEQHRFDAPVALPTGHRTLRVSLMPAPVPAEGGMIRLLGSARNIGNALAA